MIDLIPKQFAAGFFDRPHVHKAVETGKRRGLSQFGGYVRKVAQRSIRNRKAASAPGEPPSSHTKDLRKWILYAFEPPDNVIIGPAKLNQVFFGNDRKPVKGTVPQVLEEGGAITLLEVFKFGKWQRADLRSRRRNANLPTRYRRVEIEARPYMLPAFMVAKQKGIGPAFKNSVRAA